MNKVIQGKLNRFFAQYKEQKYLKGDILIRANDEPPGIIYLKKGIVKQYSISTAGEEQILTIYKPGAFFPMMWAINDTHNRYYFETMINSELYCAPKKDAIAFIKREPEILYDLVSRLYRGMSGLLSRIEYLMFGDAYHRVLFTILTISYQFGQKNTQEQIVIKTTHKEIGSLSGLTKETISRESAKLQKKNLIVNKNRSIIINDLKKLEEELESLPS